MGDDFGRTRSRKEETNVKQLQVVQLKQKNPSTDQGVDMMQRSLISDSEQPYGGVAKGEDA